MKTKHLLRAILFTLFLIPFACQKELQPLDVNPNLNIEDAKNWFNGKYGTQNSRMQNDKNGKIADWGKAKVKQLKDGMAIIVPVKYNIFQMKSLILNNKKNYNVNCNVYNYLLLKQDKKNKWYEEFIELSPNNDYVNKSKNRTIEFPFEGSLRVTDWSGKVINHFYLKNGIIVGSDKNKKNGRINESWTGCWVTSYYMRDDKGNYTGEVYNSEPYDCTTFYWNPYDGIPDYNQNGGGNYGDNPGGPSYGGSSEDKDVVEDELTDPCLQNVLNFAINQGLNTTANDILTNFNMSRTLKLVISNEPMGTGWEDVSGTSRKVSDNKYKITFNDDAIQNATKEYIYGTLLHEVIHAELIHRGIKNELSQHIIMGESYMNGIARALQINFGLTLDISKAIAWGGLQDSAAWKNLSESDKNKYINLNKSYRNGKGKVGTKPCD